MSTPPYKVLALDTKKHNRSNFNSAEDALNTYLATQVSQDIKRSTATCFVAVTAGNDVAGYYTLSAGGILLTDLPDATAKKLPRYPHVPVALMGRLAVDKAHAGQGLGQALLADAILRVKNSGIGIWAIVVHAKHQQAAAFYAKRGFIPFASSPLTMFLPV